MNNELYEKIRSIFEEKLNISFADGTVNRLGGLTNFNYKVDVAGKSYVVRLPGKGTESLINRHDEYLATKLTNEIRIDAENIYFDASTGIKVSRYIEEAVTMNESLVKETPNMEHIARVFHKLHHCGKSIPVNFDVFDKIVEYENLLNAEEGDFFWPDYSEIRKEIYGLKSLYQSFSVRPVICHNDPLCENFVLGRNGMYLVDWEYAGMNDPMWDLADIFIEGSFNECEEALFKSYYFNVEASEEEEMRILMNKIFLDFLWSLWGKQRYACGEDLNDYANMRYERAKENLKKLTIDTLVTN